MDENKFTLYKDISLISFEKEKKKKTLQCEINLFTLFFYSLSSFFHFSIVKTLMNKIMERGKKKKNKNNVPLRWIRKFNKLARDTKDDDYINEFLNTNEIFFRSL